MTKTTGAKSISDEKRPRRARWQLVLGVGLLAAAGLMAIGRLVSPLLPAPVARCVEPIPLRLPVALKPCSTVPTKTGEFGGCNFLLVTFDTTRADRIGCYGNTGIETPNLDRLAHEGVVFTQAIAPAPVTLASHASILTGMYPFHHGARTNTLSRLDDKYGTLAEILSEAGYQTGAFVSAFVLDPQFGIARGFQDYDADVLSTSEFWEAIDERAADKTSDLALTWLAEHSDEPFFLWVHYFDPHWAYQPPSPYAEKYKQMPYDGEIAFADAQLGRLLAALDKSGLTDKTLVVVAGDHGEGLLQHDEPTHGFLVFDSTLKVPLIIRCGKRLGAGVHYDGLVCLTDIMPTVLSLLGIKEKPRMDGVDLTQAAAGPRAVFIETMEGLSGLGWSALLGVRTESAKYIHGPNPALYDLSRDADEQTNLISSRADLAADMRRQTTDFFGADLKQAATLHQTTPLSPGDLARLESLGYVSAGGSTSAPSESPLDPMQMMPLLRRVSQAIDPTASNWLDKAATQLESIVQQYPDFYLVHRELAVVYAQKGDMRKAEAAIKHCLELRPNAVLPLYNMAMLKDQQKDVPGAIDYYRRVLVIFPDHLPTLTRLAQLLWSEGQRNEAATLFKHAHDVQPAHEVMCINAAEALAAAGRAEEAVAVLRQALTAAPKLVRVRNRLALALRSQGHFDESAAILRDGLKRMPDRPDLAANLAIILMSTPDPQGLARSEAVAILERVCERTGDKRPEYAQALSRAYASAGRIDEAISTAEKARRWAMDAARSDLAETISMDLAAFRKAKTDGLAPTTTSAPSTAS